MTDPETRIGADPAPSPCTGVCRIERTTGSCEGCLRTLDEIAAWGALDEPGRRALLETLARRRQQMPSSPGSPSRSATTAAGSPGSASRG